jgi:hypothetical protein
MFGLPGDTPWIWLGLVLGAAVMGGVVADHPTPPPDANRVAAAIDGVAARPHATGSSVVIHAEAVRLHPVRLAVRGPGGTAHAQFEYGPVTPVQPDTPLAAVLHGTRPGRVFANTTAFREALHRARADAGAWQTVDHSLTVRRVQHGEVNCVLVGT